MFRTLGIVVPVLRFGLLPAKDTSTKILSSFCSSYYKNSVYLCKNHRYYCSNSRSNNNDNEFQSTCSESDPKTDYSSDEKSDTEYERDIKNKILEASLSFVPIHGWTKNAIAAGADSIGYPNVIKEMFPLGGTSLVLYLNENCNLRLKEYLISKVDTALVESDNRKSIKLFIADAIEFRLRLIIPYIDKWPQALATLTNPKAVPTALSNLLNLVDDIAHYGGDRSADLDWYIRRVGIAGIYKLTELYMLQDKSPDYVNTWAFLQRQIDDAVTLYSCIKPSQNATQFTKDFSSATLTTARNMLGLNWNR